MEKSKMNSLDTVFLLSSTIIPIIGGLIDVIYWHNATYGGFPVFSCTSIFVSYAIWITLLIYSWVSKKYIDNKPKYVKWYMYFLLPFIHIFFAMISFILFSFISSLIS